ncbi:hypothetical protein [Rhizobium sp. 22-785-1]
MSRFRHHIIHAAEAGGFQAGLAAASSCDKPLLLPPLPDAGHVCVTPAVAGEAVSALRMAGDGFVPRLDLRPDVFGERHALRRKAEASFAGPSALRHRGGLVLAGLLSGLEVFLPIIDENLDIPRGVFAALSGAATCAAFISRILAQKGIVDADQQDHADTAG